MTDEKIVPLMSSDDNKEEIDENEGSPLLKYNKRENIQNINNNGIRNIELNYNQKMSLIFLSFAVQIFIYFLFLRHFKNKDNFIKQHINIFFVISIIVASYLLLMHGFNYAFFKKIAFKYLILISLISSFSLFCFLYKFSISFTFDKIKYILLIVCSAYLNMAFNYSFGFTNDNITRGTFILSCIFPFLISFILIFCKIFSIKAFIFNVILASFLCIFSILHMDYLVKGKHCGINDYPILNICLYIDIFIISIYFFIIYLSDKSKRNRYGNKYIHHKKEEKKSGLLITPYDIFHPNETDKYHQQ